MSTEKGSNQSTSIWDEPTKKALTRMYEKEGLAPKEIAEAFEKIGIHTSPDAVEKKIKRMELKRPSRKIEELSIEEAVKEIRTKKELSSTKHKASELLERIRMMEDSVDAWKEIVGNKTIIPLTPITPQKMHATAISLLSDIHYEERVKPESVNNVNRYDVKIAAERLSVYFNDVAAHLIMKYNDKNTSIDHFVLAILGDIISGNIHEELLALCQYEPVEAAIQVQALLAGGIQMLEALCKKLKIPFTIVCKVGNHGRITKKIHVSAEQGNSLEYFVYKTLAQMFPGINWIIEKNYHTYLNIYDRNIRFHHGWAINYNGGIGGIMIAMAKANDAWDEQIPAALNVCAHWHTQLYAHRTMMNGSVIGYNAYSVRIKAKFEPPAQKFFLYTSEGRVTGEYSIFLDR